MKYRLSVESFDKSFAVKEDGRKLTHLTENRYMLFPFIPNNNSVSVCDLDSIVGRYISQVEKIKPQPITVEELTARLMEETEITPGSEELFQQVVKSNWFDWNGNIRSTNIRMITQIPCEEPRAQKVADYLVDVLGDEKSLKISVDHANSKLEEQSNVLEKYIISKLESKPLPPRDTVTYQRITNALHKKYEEDFEYVLGSRNKISNYLIPLLEFYYFTYTAQTILQLNRFFSGDRDNCIPLYFCLDWEKTSLNRLCYTQGWGMLQEKTKSIFAHAMVHKILNQTEEDYGPVDYITLDELAQEEGEDHRIAEEIKVLTERYRNAIPDCPKMKELRRQYSAKSETAAEVRFLFESVRTQFENTSRNRVYTAYADKFSEYVKKYLKRRGRSGMMLNLTEETLIFLTKVCIKDQEMMRLNDVFNEFELRGVYLDNISKEQVMRYYEKLNLIEKKSDSGDAQYVKRIL